MLSQNPQLTDIRDRDQAAKQERLQRLQESKRPTRIPSNLYIKDITTVKVRVRNNDSYQLPGVKAFFQDLARLAAISGLVIAVIGIGISLFIWHTNRVSQDATAKANSAVITDQSTTDSTPVSQPAATGAPTQLNTSNSSPSRIIISKIGVNASVITVGLVDGNQIGTPSTITQTAWYNGSSKPGQAGATLIDGHVADYSTPGVFYNLKNLSPGDEIQVQLVNGVTINYDVVKSIAYPSTSVDMNAVLSPVNPDRSGLNLITCTGDVIPGTNAFNERLVVFAQQI